MLWIRTARQKTGTPCDIPLLELPKQIIEKYEGIAKDGKLLQMLSCGSLNKNLKVIVKLCNIERKLIYHQRRHNHFVFSADYKWLTSTLIIVGNG